MKAYQILGFLFIWTLLIAGSCEDEVVPPLECENGFLTSTDNSTCECPEDTHIEVRGKCYEIREREYLGILEDCPCIPDTVLLHITNTGGGQSSDVHTYRTVEFNYGVPSASGLRDYSTPKFKFTARWDGDPMVFDSITSFGNMLHNRCLELSDPTDALFHGYLEEDRIVGKIHYQNDFPGTFGRLHVCDAEFILLD